MKTTVWQIAKEYALYTRTPIFLTGRAGTGKTTLLKEILENSKKNMAVVAPTGVAAINAGGMTIHSFFQLPLTGFIPTNDHVDPDHFTNRITLARTQKMSRERIQVLLELEMLVIDEISMVRADLLDAIDAVLCRIRKNSLPFGGVQVMVIGDLFQLSPVVRNDSFRTLSDYYDSPYFFDSWVWKKSEAITLELIKIYRQDDEAFIRILNNIRVGEKIIPDLELLNQRLNPTKKLKNIITLTTHNAKANAINNRELEAIRTKPYHLKAEITGKFSSSSYPVNEEIILKKGCQVMFIRNHQEGLYFNGKIGEVIDKKDDDIIVSCDDNEPPIRVQPTEWKNVKYTIDQETKEVHKEDIGSFIQYPLQLAWAVTVHKSQGLTFDEMILDLVDSFAPGQLYVALSRSRSLNGLHLLSPISPENIIVDDRIIQYYQQNAQPDFSPDHLAKAKAVYEDIKIGENWSFTKLLTYVDLWEETIENSVIPEEDKVLEIVKIIKKALEELDKTGVKFQGQLNILTQQYKSNDDVLHRIIERCHKAVLYFTGQIHSQIIILLEKHYAEYNLKSRTKRYLPVVTALISDLWAKMNGFYNLKYRSIPIHPEEPKFQKVQFFNPDKKRASKGATYKITLELLNEDRSIEEIAKIRSLATGTIESHMNRLLKEDKISLDQIMNHERQLKIIPYMEKHQEGTLSEIKTKIPFDTSFGELRWIQTYLAKREIAPK